MTSLKVFLRYSFPAGLALIPLCSVKVVPAQRHGDQEATYLYYCFTHRGKDCRFASEKEAAEQYEKVKRCKPTKKDRDSIIPNEYARRRLQIMMPALKEFSPGHYNCTVCWPPPPWMCHSMSAESWLVFLLLGACSQKRLVDTRTYFVESETYQKQSDANFSNSRKYTYNSAVYHPVNHITIII